MGGLVGDVLERGWRWASVHAHCNGYTGLGIYPLERCVWRSRAVVTLWTVRRLSGGPSCGAGQWAALRCEEALGLAWRQPPGELPASVARVAYGTPGCLRCALWAVRGCVVAIAPAALVNVSYGSCGLFVCLRRDPRRRCGPARRRPNFYLNMKHRCDENASPARGGAAPRRPPPPPAGTRIHKTRKSKIQTRNRSSVAP